MTVHQTMDDGTVFPELNVTLSEDWSANACGTSNQVGDEVQPTGSPGPVGVALGQMEPTDPETIPWVHLRISE